MEYPVAQAGGVEAIVVELVRGLASEFSLVLVSDDNAESLAASGLAPLVAKQFPWRVMQGTSATAKHLAVALNQAGVELAHFHLGGTYAWGSRIARHCPIPMTARLGIPVVITNHFVQPALEGYCGDSRPLWFKRAFFPVAWGNRLLVLNHARREFTDFLYEYHLLRRIFWPLRKKIGHMYHSALDVQEPGPALTADCRPPVILMVATIAPRKYQRVLIEAFDRIASAHPEWTLRIVGYVGDNAYYEQIRTMDAARRLGKRLEFAGPLGRADTMSAMHAASIFVGQGLALQEAIFRGCACVSFSFPSNSDLTEHGRTGSLSAPNHPAALADTFVRFSFMSNSEVVEHGRTGLVSPPNDPAALAKTLETLITQPSLRRQLAEQGRASILEKGMTRQQMVRRHADLYRSLLACEAKSISRR
jgi:glycosyltransferase involved in cell wall biosynthesis